MQLLSINTGKPQLLDGSREPTGIVKQPVQGPVAIGKLGIEGDAVLDKKYHGGPDQALYLYFQPDYEWWMEARGEAIAPGSFGENLTISGMESAGLCVGDRLTIGDLVLEVTAPRAPCNTLARRMKDPQIVKAFFKAGRPGAYVRVVTPATISAGMAVAFDPYQGARITLGELLEGHVNPTPEMARRYLEAPISERLRSGFEKRL